MRPLVLFSAAVMNGMRRWRPWTRVGRKAFAKQYAALTIANVGTAAASFVSVAVLARVVSVEEFGRIIFAQATVTSAFIVLDPRFEDAVVRFVPLLAKQAGAGAATGLFRRALFLDGMLGVLFAGLGFGLLSMGLLPMGGIADNTFFTLAVLQLGFQAAAGTAAAGFSVTDGLTQLGILQTLATVATTAAAVIGLMLGGPIWYLGVLAGAAVLTTALLSAVALWRVRQHYGASGQLPPGWAGRVARFSLVASLASSVRMGIDTLPLSVIGVVSGPGSLGVFRVALAPARLTATAFSPLPSILFPMLSRDAAGELYGRIRSRVLVWTRMTVPLAFGLGAIAWIALPTIVPVVFGASYVTAVEPARFLVLAALVRGSTAWSKILPFAVGKPGTSLTITSLDAGLLLAATWWIGSVGTATGVAIAHLVIAIALTVVWISFGASFKPRTEKASELVAG